jgi:hypothetical protein
MKFLKIKIITKRRKQKGTPFFYSILIKCKAEALRSEDRAWSPDCVLVADLPGSLRLRDFCTEVGLIWFS